MSKPVVVLAGQSNASRISQDVLAVLDAAYGAGNYELVHAYAAGAPLTRARTDKADWESPDELLAGMIADTQTALNSDPDAYFAGTIWVQGEADTYAFSSAADYTMDFVGLFEDFHNAIGVNDASVTISRLSDLAPEAETRDNWDMIQASHDVLADTLDWVSLVDPDLIALESGVLDSAMFSDGLHYSDSFSAALATTLVTSLPGLDLTGNQVMSGTQGADTLNGSSAADLVLADAGDDKVYAGVGADVVALGDGDDYVLVGGGEERFDGGAGHDYISYYHSRNGILIDLRDNEVSGSWAANDKISGFESASGSFTGDDIMLGTAGDNVFRAYGGDDSLYGRAGSDTLYGGDGEDFLDGGAGWEVDHLFGEGGADRFHFDFGEGIDIVRDFENNIDTVELDGFDMTAAEALGLAVQSGTDVVLDFGVGGHLTIQNATIAELQNDLVMV